MCCSRASICARARARALVAITGGASRCNRHRPVVANVSSPIEVCAARRPQRARGFSPCKSLSLPARARAPRHRQHAGTRSASNGARAMLQRKCEAPRVSHPFSASRAWRASSACEGVLHHACTVAQPALRRDGRKRACGTLVAALRGRPSSATLIPCAPNRGMMYCHTTEKIHEQRKGSDYSGRGNADPR